MADDDEFGEEESDDIVEDFQNTPEGELKESMQEENLGDDEYDYQQGFSYPEQKYKDSTTKFFRHIISLMKPLQVVRVANFAFREKTNAKNYLWIAEFNRIHGMDLIAKFCDQLTIIEAAASMGYKGFTTTAVTTQTRVVKRMTDKPMQQGAKSWAKPQQVQGATYSR